MSFQTSAYIEFDNSDNLMCIYLFVWNRCSKSTMYACVDLFSCTSAVKILAEKINLIIH